MSSKLPTIASCPRCGTIVLRASGTLVHPTSAERETIRRALGSYWFHHARARFDGRFHRCPDRDRLDPDAEARRQVEAEKTRPTGPRARPRASWIVFQVAAAMGLAAGAAAEAGSPGAPPEAGAVAAHAGSEGGSLDPDAHPGAHPAASWRGLDLSGGRYQVTEMLGMGASGLTLRARDRNLDHDVVVEVPNPPRAATAAFPGRFLRGVRTLSLLSHPHLVKVTEVGIRDGSPFAVTEYLPGGSLKYRRPIGEDGRPAPMSPASLEAWLPDVAGALDFLHARGHLHRDVRPANILFDEQGRAYLGGLGMAGAIEAAAEAEPPGTSVPAGLTLGFPGYMAPEQAAGQATDGRADEYSLAVVVYEWLCGRRPFEGHTAMSVLVEQLTREPRSLHRVCPTIPKPISSAVGRGLDRDPRRRYPDCMSFARAVVAASHDAIASGASPASGAEASQPPVAVMKRSGPSRRGVSRAGVSWPVLASAGVALVTVSVVLALRRPRHTTAAHPDVVEPGPIADSLRVVAATDLGIVLAPELPTSPDSSTVTTRDLERTDLGGSPAVVGRPRRMFWAAWIGARALGRDRVTVTRTSRVALDIPKDAGSSGHSTKLVRLDSPATGLAPRVRPRRRDVPRRLAG